jgi:[acyl-carrier-protein] S-malonyltransferase
LAAGGIAATARSESGQAAAVAEAVTAGVEVDPAQVRSYYDRNIDLYTSDSGIVDFDQVRGDIHCELLEAARAEVFSRWLDVQGARRVVLCAGFEHPGDPRQPDATHHH